MCIYIYIITDGITINEMDRHGGFFHCHTRLAEGTLIPLSLVTFFVHSYWKNCFWNWIIAAKCCRSEDAGPTWKSSVGSFKVPENLGGVRAGEPHSFETWLTRAECCKAEVNNGLVRSGMRHYGAEMKHIYGDSHFEALDGPAGFMLGAALGFLSYMVVQSGFCLPRTSGSCRLWLDSSKYPYTRQNRGEGDALSFWDLLSSRGQASFGFGDILPSTYTSLSMSNWEIFLG